MVKVQEEILKKYIKITRVVLEIHQPSIDIHSSATTVGSSGSRAGLSQSASGSGMFIFSIVSLAINSRSEHLWLLTNNPQLLMQVYDTTPVVKLQMG